jgi:hypothetical protein
MLVFKLLTLFMVHEIITVHSEVYIVDLFSDNESLGFHGSKDSDCGVLGCGTV